MIKMNGSSKVNNTASQYSSIEKFSLIRGGVDSDDDFRIDGIIDGNLKTAGKIIVGKNGHLLGKAECVNAEIEGHFNGELHVTGLLILRATAVVEGTIFMSKLAVEPGAIFNATCNMRGQVSPKRQQGLAVG